MALIQMPGTNFHDLDLDWLLEQVKNLLEEWEEMKSAIDELIQDNASFKEQVESLLGGAE